MNNNAQFSLKLIWEAGEGHKYALQRIPGMIVTEKGTLIIYNEARFERNDWAPMEIYAQRSTDHGDTFGDPIYLAPGDDQHKTVNNPVMVQDKNGRIHFLYCEDYGIRGGRIVRRYSDDDGITWSAPIDITPFTVPEYRNVFAIGPGHGVCTKDGTLVFPVWMVPKKFGCTEVMHWPSVISTVYSRDNGESWQIGEILPTTADIINPNETSICLLSDGRVYLNVRHMVQHRAMAISENGYSNWVNYVPDKRLIDPVCFGSVAHYNDGVNPYTVVFANCEHKSARKNVVVKASVSDTVNWEYRKVIDSERGGYVEVTADSANGWIYVLYENKAGETVHLARFNHAWLTSKD